MCAARYLVEKEKIVHNIQTLWTRVGEGRLYAVLKADGYGLGCREMAALCGENGLTHFAVTDLRDARAVVASGARVEELLLMSSAAPEEIPELIRLGVTFTVASERDAENLRGLNARAHIKVDTGMGRRGLYFDCPQAIAQLYSDYSDIHFAGIYTHFASAVDARSTQEQFSRFRSVLQSLESAGIQVGIRHCCGSVAALLYDEMVLDGIRVGSALLGRVNGGAEFGLQRTGVCIAPVEMVKDLPKGATVGYGRTFRAKKDMRIAICQVGTYHGFALCVHSGRQNLLIEITENLRRIRNRFIGRNVPTVRIGGKICRVLGCVCSELVILDVTDVPCQPGDAALFDINPILLRGMPVVFE